MSRGNRHRWSLRLTQWHRWAGITAALLVVVLASTGLALQHAPALGLDRSPVGAPMVARALGIDAGTVRAFRVGDAWLLGTRDAIYLDGRLVASISELPSGAIDTPFGLAVAAGGDVLLLDNEGNLLERLRADGALPGGVQRLGRSDDGRPVVETSEGRYRPRRRWLAFATLDGEVRAWSSATKPPEPLARRVRRQQLAQAVTWERLLLEVHSGRIAGQAGVLIMDAAAVLLLVLALSGVYLWWRRR